MLLPSPFLLIHQFNVAPMSQPTLTNLKVQLSAVPRHQRYQNAWTLCIDPSRMAALGLIISHDALVILLLWQIGGTHAALLHLPILPPFSFDLTLCLINSSNILNTHRVVCQKASHR